MHPFYQRCGGGGGGGGNSLPKKKEEKKEEEFFLKRKKRNKLGLYCLFSFLGRTYSLKCRLSASSSAEYERLPVCSACSSHWRILRVSHSRHQLPPDDPHCLPRIFMEFNNKATWLPFCNMGSLDAPPLQLCF